MGKQQQDKKPAAAPDKLFVFGMDDMGRPRGARFAQHNDRVVNAALDLSLNAVKVASPAFAEAAKKLLAAARQTLALVQSTTYGKEHYAGVARFIDRMEREIDTGS